MEVLPGLRQVQPGPGSCNVFLWKTGGELVLIDAGLELDTDAVLEALRHHGSEPADVTHILVSHRHGDHAGGLSRLADATGAAIGAHKEDAGWIETGGRYTEDEGPTGDSEETIVRTRLRPFPVGLRFQDGAELPGGMIAVHTPGHTPGHTSFYHPGERFLLVGDALLNFPPLSGPAAAFSWNIEQARASVLRLLKLDIGAIGFGHGPPIIEEEAGELHALIQEATD